MFTEPVQSRLEKRQATHQRVLASAERLFREYGFNATTIRQIAAETHVSVGTVMAVGGKDQLLVAIFDRWIATVHQGRDIAHRSGRAYPDPAAPAREIMDLFEPFISYFALDRELSREYAAIIVRGVHESAIFQDLALALTAELHGMLTRSGHTNTQADLGSRSIYFAYLGLLMTASNGAMEQTAMVKQLSEIVGFVTQRSGEEG